MRHEISLTSPSFERVVAKEQTALLVRDDIDLQVADELEMHHTDGEERSSRNVRARILHILRNASGQIDGLDEGYAVLSISVVERSYDDGTRKPTKQRTTKKAPPKQETVTGDGDS